MRILSPLRPLMAPLLSAALLAPLLSTTARAAPIRDPAQQEQEEQQQEQQTTNIQEVVVVTASRTEELLLEAPTAITVIAADDIALSPAQNYADLMRGVPGLNVIQTSARDVSMSSRSSTNTLDASQLVLIDGPDRVPGLLRVRRLGPVAAGFLRDRADRGDSRSGDRRSGEPTLLAA